MPGTGRIRSSTTQVKVGQGLLNVGLVRVFIDLPFVKSYTRSLLNSGMFTEKSGCRVELLGLVGCLIQLIPNWSRYPYTYAHVGLYTHLLAGNISGSTNKYFMTFIFYKGFV